MNRSKKLGGLMLVVISVLAAGIVAALAAGTPPVLQSTTPGNGASVQSAPTVAATYDQPLHSTSTLVVRDKSTAPIAGTTTFSANTITFTPTSALTALGTPYAATATVRNADNDEQVVTAWTFSIDTTAPSAPTISSVHGDSTTPATGNDSSPTIVVSGVVAGDTVRVRAGGIESGPLVVPAEATTVTFNVDEATENFLLTAGGNHSLTATSADPTGNVSAASAPFTYTLDTTPPGAPTIDSIAGDIESPATGNDSTPRVVVSGVVAGDTVRVLDGTTEVASKLVPALATSVTFNSLTATDFTLAEDGLHTFTAVAVDPVGNATPSASGFEYTLETGAPNAPTIVSIDGVVTSPAVGDDPTPTIVVSGEAGDTVRVYEGALLRATKVVPLGADSVTFNDDPLVPDVLFAPDGDHTITATSTDPSGNVSAASSSFLYTLDTGVIAPMFVGTSPADDSTVQPPATVTATYSERLDGRQSTLTVTNGLGNPPAGTVTFSAGAQTIIFTPSEPLTEAGNLYTATAAVRDGNGNLTTTTWSFSVDTTDPAAPAITSVHGDTTSPAAGSDPSPAIVVSGVVAGETVRIFEGDTERDAKVVPTGETSVTFNAGADTEVVLTGDGSHSLTATATDEAGNLSAPSAAFVYNLDTTEPGVPTITSVNADSTSPAAGADPSPTIVVSGVIAGDTVRILEGSTERGTTVVPTGATTVTFNAADADTDVVLTGDESHSLTATAADPFDNRSAPSAAFLYSLDTTAPAVPTITSVDGQATSPAGGTDRSPAIVVSGVVAGDTVRIVEGDTELDAKAVPTGATSVTFNAAAADSEVVFPTDGSHSLTATATDPAGNRSAPSAAFLYSLDATGPVAPTITSVDGKTTSPALGTDTTPTIVVSGVVAGDTVRILEGSTVRGTTVVPTGATSVTFNAAPADTDVVLTDGAAHSLTATATDPMGNPSAPSTAFVYSLDSTDPVAPTIASVDGKTTSPAVGTDPSPTIVVSGVDAGDTVRIMEGGTERGAKVVPTGATSVTFNNGGADTEVVLTGDGSHTLTATATDPSGNLSAPSAAFVYGLTTSFPGEFHELSPARVLDTRNGTGGFSAPVGPAGTIAVPVAGQGGVPANGASAVVLNVTITQPTADTFLTVFPNGTTRPLASNLNALPGKTVPNLVIAKLGADGKVAVYNNVGTSHVIYDVMGWFSDTTGANGARFSSLTPARILDTRAGTGGFNAPVAAGGTISADVTGVGGVPADGVSAVVLNVTATQPTAGESFLTVFPAGATRPLASNLNFVAGQTVPNLVMAKVGADGKVSIYNNLGTSHVIFDVVGWFGSDADTAGARYNALSPARILDTRTGNGGFSAPVGPAATISPTVVGVGGVPATGVTAVVLNVTVTQPTAGESFLTVFPAGATRPLASNLNFLAGQTVPNLVMAKVGADGKVSVFNNLGTSHVIFDVVGWYSE